MEGSGKKKTTTQFSEVSRKNLATSIRVGIWAGVGWGSLGRLHIKRDETSAQLLNDEIIGKYYFRRHLSEKSLYQR